MMLNFTCLEKKQALLGKSVNQTIRVNGMKYLMPAKNPLEGSPHNYDFRPLHIWWNARNFHVEDKTWCNCGLQMGVPCASCGNSFKTQGLGKSQFLGMGEITSIVKKKVKDITEEDAIADGFKPAILAKYPESKGTYQETYKQFEDVVIKAYGVDARGCCQHWILSHNKNLTLESFIYVIQWRWL